MDKLAIEGGPKAKRTPFGKRKRHGEAEKKLLSDVIDSDMLFFFSGTKVAEFQKTFAALYGRRHCIACSSGTASVHIAIAALQLPPGSEVIVPAITDMGSLTGVLYQGLIPVFADVEPGTLNMNPTSVREKVSDRTRAILAVHHAGLPADVDALAEIGRACGATVVEDCAQAYCAETRGRLVGTITEISAFSLNHFKHITCGSGGMVLTDDDRLRYIASLFLDKCYQREEQIRNPFFLAPNYQMTELQGAVALAQLARVREVVDSRNCLGTKLNALLGQVPEITPQTIPDGSRHSYFMYLFRLNLPELGCTAREFSEALGAEGVPNDPNTITGGRPVYLYDIFRNRSAFPDSHYPFDQSDRVYRPGDCPVAEAAFDSWISMPLQEHYTTLDIDEIAEGIGKVARYFATRRMNSRTEAHA